MTMPPSYYWWVLYGVVLQSLWVLVVLLVTYLLFILQRRHAGATGRVCLGCSLGWLGLTVLFTSLQFYNSLSYQVGLPTLPVSFWGSFLWQLQGGVLGSLFLVVALGFLGLAVRERRAKRRVAPDRKT